MPGGARTHNVGVGGRGFIQLDYRHIFINLFNFYSVVAKYSKETFCNLLSKLFTIGGLCSIQLSYGYIFGLMRSVFPYLPLYFTIFTPLLASVSAKDFKFY